MIDYTIAAHPTMYHGTRFRSRLEARWAAFFDLLKWRWEYEPFDLKGWVPDFILIGDNKDALVEIKPTVRPDNDTICRITKASFGRSETLVYGSSVPFNDWQYIASLISCCNCVDEYKCHWMSRIIGVIEDRYDIIIGHNDEYTGMLGNIHNLKLFKPYRAKEITDAWILAGNKVRWKP